MLRTGDTQVVKEKVNVDNRVISKLVQTKSNFKYLIGYLDEAIRLLVLIMPKISGYVKTFKVEDEDKDKNNKLINRSFDIYDENLLEKCKTIWTKIEDLNSLPVYGDRYIKTEIKTYNDKVYTNFCALNVPEDDIECESFTVFSIDFLLVSENKYYLQVYLDICAYKIANKQMEDYLDDNLFED